MLSVEATGKNIEQAVQNALLELKASREDVDIKILSEGGFLKKAKVQVSISADAVEKYEKKEKARQTLVEEEKADDDFAESFLKNKIEKTEKEEKKAEKEVKKQTKETEKAEKKEEKEQVKAEKKVRISVDDEISSKPAKKEKVEEERKLTPEEFLKGLLASMSLEAEIESSEDEKFVRFNLTGENLNDLIGHHGDCMLALNQIMNSVCKTPDHKRVILDIEGYRQKREESLTSLAKRIADKVAKTHRYYKFEPMDASERKIIHTALQEDDRVTTLSKGEEPHRYLMVFPKEYDDRD